MKTRMERLVDINNQMCQLASEMRRDGQRDEAARLEELALGVWSVMCSISRAERGTEVTS